MNNELQNTVQPLTWGLVIPTYKREAILLRCLRLAAQQTLKPKEIIVVDASPTWEQTYNQVMNELAIHTPAIQWKYVQAKRLSSAAQRNQGIELSSSDILFLIDDDSLMYPECAEKVIQIYTQDIDQRIVGIMPFLNPIPPDRLTTYQGTQKRFLSFKNRYLKIRTSLRAFLKKLIKEDNIFIPYDFRFHTYPLPEKLKKLAIHCVPMIHGARMSFRRTILQQVRFEETLQRYAVNEDNDVCYRASRYGVLLHALEAHLCHLQVSEGRLSRFTVTALWGLNLTVLHRFHSTDLAKFEKLFTQLLWQRVATQFIKDLLERRWTFPSVRGIWFILQHYQEILTRSSEELRHWYPEFQQQLITKDFGD